MRKSTTGTIVLTGVLALAAVNPGCAFTFMEAAPENHEKLPYFDCTSTYGLSVSDALWAAFWGLTGGVTLSATSHSSDQANGPIYFVGGVFVGLAGLLTASAVYGVVQSTRCDRAKNDLKARIFAPSLRPIVPPEPAPEPPGPPEEAPEETP